MPICDDVDWKKLNDLTEGYSGADVANVCRDAAMMPLRKKIAAGNFDVMALKN